MYVCWNCDSQIEHTNGSDYSGCPECGHDFLEPEDHDHVCYCPGCQYLDDPVLRAILHKVEDEGDPDMADVMAFTDRVLETGTTDQVTHFYRNYAYGLGEPDGIIHLLYYGVFPALSVDPYWKGRTHGEWCMRSADVAPRDIVRERILAARSGTFLDMYFGVNDRMPDRLKLRKK